MILETATRQRRNTVHGSRGGYKFSFYPDRSIRYLPDIYDYGESAFRIQTTSYGSLPPEEIRKLIAGYQTALNAIQMVEEAFTGRKR